MSCYCLCVVNHPDKHGICTGEATGEVKFSGFPEESPLAPFDEVVVRMCDPCRKSTFEKHQAVETDIETP